MFEIKPVKGKKKEFPLKKRISIVLFLTIRETLVFFPHGSKLHYLVKVKGLKKFESKSLSCLIRVF